jgi:hypothetical protein
VLNIVQSIRDGAEFAVSAAIHEGEGVFMATVEVSTVALATVAATTADGVVDHILLDVDRKREDSEAIIDAVRPSKSGLLRYSDLSAWTTAILDVVAETSRRDIARTRLLVAGSAGHPLADAMVAAARTRGAHVSVPGDNAEPCAFDVVIACDSLAFHEVRRFTAPLIMDALIGAIPPHEVAAYQAAGVIVLRPDMRASLHAEVMRAIAVRELVNATAGCSIFDGIPIAAGGVVAPRGTIVVDSIARPGVVHGVADGAGSLVEPLRLNREFAERLRHARTVLLHTVR